MPALDRTLERTIVAGSGASVYASGCHAWKGKSGLLIEKASAKAKKAR